MEGQKDELDKPANSRGSDAGSFYAVGGSTTFQRQASTISRTSSAGSETRPRARSARGWVQKRGRLGATWSSRWFELDATTGKLRYYHEELSKKKDVPVRGEIDLWSSNCRILENRGDSAAGGNASSAGSRPLYMTPVRFMATGSLKPDNVSFQIECEAPSVNAGEVVNGRTVWYLATTRPESKRSWVEAIQAVINDNPDARERRRAARRAFRAAINPALGTDGSGITEEQDASIRRMSSGAGLPSISDGPEKYGSQQGGLGPTSSFFRRARSLVDRSDSRATFSPSGSGKYAGFVNLTDVEDEYREKITLFKDMGFQYLANGCVVNRVPSTVPGMPDITRVSTVVHAPAERVFDLLYDAEMAPRWNPEVESVRLVESIDESAQIYHMVYRPTRSSIFYSPKPRDVCLLSVSRVEEDGSRILLCTSTEHPACPAYPEYVRAQVWGSGYSVIPRKAAAKLASMPEDCLLTRTSQTDLKIGWWGRFVFGMYKYFFGTFIPNIDDMMSGDNLVHVVAGVRELVEHGYFTDVEIAEDQERLSEMRGAPASNIELTSLDEEEEDQSLNSMSRLKSFGSIQIIGGSLDTRYWEEPDVSDLRVRGKTYMEDKQKILAAEGSKFALAGVDIFQSNERLFHVATHAEGLYKKTSANLPYLFIINLIMPGPPFLSCVLYFAARNKLILQSDTPFGRLLRKFINGDAITRKSLLKLVPRIVEGSWLIRNAVGTTPAILGKKVAMTVFTSNNYCEVDFDVGGGAAAASITNLCLPATKSLVVDMAFLFEGQSADELPEEILGAVRFRNVDLRQAKKV